MNKLMICSTLLPSYTHSCNSTDVMDCRWLIGLSHLRCVLQTLVTLRAFPIASAVRFNLKGNYSYNVYQCFSNLSWSAPNHISSFITYLSYCKKKILIWTCNIVFVEFLWFAVPVRVLLFCAETFMLLSFLCFCWFVLLDCHSRCILLPRLSITLVCIY